MKVRTISAGEDIYFLYDHRDYCRHSMFAYFSQCLLFVFFIFFFFFPPFLVPCPFFSALD